VACGCVCNIYTKEAASLGGGSFLALNLVLFDRAKTLYLGPKKFLKKSVKNLKKVLTFRLRCGIIATPRKKRGQNAMQIV
jgi:hypothetical protein